MRQAPSRQSVAAQPSPQVAVPAHPEQIKVFTVGVLSIQVLYRASTQLVPPLTQTFLVYASIKHDYISKHTEAHWPHAEEMSIFCSVFPPLYKKVLE